MKLFEMQTAYAGLFLAAALALSAGANASDPPSPGSAGMPGAGPDPARLSKELDLSSAQQAQVENILQEAATRRQALRAQAGAGRSEEMQAEAMAIREQTRAQLSQVLTKQQMERFEQMHQQRMQARSTRPGQMTGRQPNSPRGGQGGKGGR
jgi:Spy/CpxP family protein refolding chaperone